MAGLPSAEFWRGRRVLLTGHTGFIGRHVSSALARTGVEVYACGRNVQSPQLTGVNWQTVDLLSREQVVKLVTDVAPQIVVHCAWYTEHGKYWAAPANADWVAASVFLAQEAYSRGASRFVGVGTGAEYAPDAASPFCELTSRIEPDTVYGLAKDTARRTIEALALSLGHSFVWTRVFMLYGDGEHPARLVSSLCRSFVKGETAKMSSGKALRDFMHVGDVGAAIAAVARSDVRGCVNIGSGDAAPIASIAKKLATLSGRPELLAIGALPDRPNEPAASFPDVSRLRDEVGFRPSVSLDDGLAAALDYWRSQENAAS